MVHDRIKTAGVEAGNFPRHVAQVLGADHIGRTKGVGQPDQGEVLQPLGHTLAKGDRSGAVLFLDGVEFGRDLGQGVVPGYFPEAPGLALALERFGQPPRLGQPGVAGPALDAGVAPVEWTGRVADDLDDPVAFNGDHQPAAALIHPSAMGDDPLERRIRLFRGHNRPRLGCTSELSERAGPTSRTKQYLLPWSPDHWPPPLPGRSLPD